MDDFDFIAAPMPFVPWNGVVADRAHVEALLGKAGTTFEVIGLGDIDGRTVVRWEDSFLVREGGSTIITVSVMIDDNGFRSQTTREIEIRDGKARLHAVNGDYTTATPHNSKPVYLWRIEDANGRGPFRPGEALRAMNIAMTGNPETCWHQTNMPTPQDEDLDQFRHLRCASPSLRTLVQWFPRPARRALAAHGYGLVRLLAAPGSAQIGMTQALYNPDRATRIDCRVL